MLQALNGQNVYNGCCALHIDFSKLKQLSVRYNNDKSRDFTKPHLGSDEPGAGNPSQPPPPGQMAGAPGIWGPYPGPGYGMDSGNSIFGFYPGSDISTCFKESSCLITMSIVISAKELYILNKLSTVTRPTLHN